MALLSQRTGSRDGLIQFLVGIEVLAGNEARGVGDCGGHVEG